MLHPVPISQYPLNPGSTSKGYCPPPYISQVASLSESSPQQPPVHQFSGISIDYRQSSPEWFPSEYEFIIFVPLT